MTLFMAARTPNIDRLGEAQQRFSYASWTAPSHYAFAMGMLPHASPRNVYASEVYKEEFLQWKGRTGSDAISFKDFLPELSPPRGAVAAAELPHRQGLDAGAQPVHADRPALRRVQADAAPQRLRRDGRGDRVPRRRAAMYYFLNLGETHYATTCCRARTCRTSSAHGVLKAIGGDAAVATAGAGGLRRRPLMKRLRRSRSVASSTSTA
ncbi:MAG: hypothetical protein MZW92_74965 [Comamonadaceae bacterium]|nr:hypothetical protein [Comamonadaceae bacterium]